MAEVRKRRPRRKQVYQHHKNAVSISVYDMTGATIPVDVRDALEQSVFDIALKNNLLINIAYE